MLERWTRGVVRWRVAVIVAWVALSIVGLFASSALSGRLTTSLAVPGSESQRANAILTSRFHENIEGTFTVLVPVRGASGALVTRFEHGVRAAVHSVPTAQITQMRAAEGILYANVTTQLSLNHAAAYTAALRRSLATHAVTGAMVTGPPALEHDLTPVLNGDLHRGQLLALSLSLLLLVAVLGLCWALLVPFVVAGATAAVSLIVVYAMARHFLMVLYIPNVVELIGLGLAVDYSLLIVHRFRREQHRHANSVEAVVAAMNSAGRTVVLSGFAVAIGLATLLLVGVPFVRSLGAAGLTVPIVALVAALTLQPALLSLLGTRGVTPVLVRGLLLRTDGTSGPWARWARRVQRHPWRVVAAASLALLVGALPLLWVRLTPGSLTAVPQGLESTHAIRYVEARLGSGVVTPLEVVLDTGRAGGAATARQHDLRHRLALAIQADPQVAAVVYGNHAPYLDASGRYERLLVISRQYFGAAATQSLVTRLREHVIPSVALPAGTVVNVGGPAAQGVDFLTRVYGSMPWIIALVLALAFLVLARAFRSLLLALVAILLDVLSVLVTFGLLVWLFRSGVATALFGTYRVSQLEGWVPVFIFAMLFGLSSDYEVFIVARMREARDAGASTADAITEGLANTGGVVSAAALILVGALSGFVVGRIAGLQELGLGLAIGVLIDATVIRGMLLPGVMTLLGRYNWWLPTWMSRPLATTPAPLDAKGSARSDHR